MTEENAGVFSLTPRPHKTYPVVLRERPRRDPDYSSPLLTKDSNLDLPVQSRPCCHYTSEQKGAGSGTPFQVRTTNIANTRHYAYPPQTGRGLDRR